MSGKRGSGGIDEWGDGEEEGGGKSGEDGCSGRIP